MVGRIVDLSAGLHEIVKILPQTALKGRPRSHAPATFRREVVLGVQVRLTEDTKSTSDTLRGLLLDMVLPVTLMDDAV